MNFTRKIEKIKQLDEHLKLRATGNPDEFCTILNISKRQLFRIIEELKDYGAPIAYSRSLRTFYYKENDFEIKISFSFRFITDQEERNIYGGYNSNNNFGAVFCHSTPII